MQSASHNFSISSHTQPRVSYYHFSAYSQEMSGGGTDIFCTSMLRFLEAQHAHVQLKLVPVAPTDFEWRGRQEMLARYLVKLINDYLRWLRTDANIHVFVYPKLPISAFTGDLRILYATAQFWRVWSRRIVQKGHKIIVVVEDLPLEQGFSSEIPNSAVEDNIENQFEHAVFCSATHLVVPSQRFADYVARKHQLERDRIMLFRRNIYMPGSATTPASNVPVIVSDSKINVLYAGGVDERLQETFKSLLRLIKRHQNVHFWICGHGQRYVEQWIASEQTANATHVGVLNHAAFDALAQRCDLGLLLYPRSFYNDMTPTMKYTGYAANGLAILSTDLPTVSENILQDGIGLAVSSQHYLEELERWLVDPRKFAEYKRRSECQMHLYRSGYYMQEWFDKVIDQSS